VLEALADARAILLCPSNPVVSIGPILALPGLREAMMSSGAPIVAVSPIVGGAPVKGPADRLLRGIGVEVSARGVASLYSDLIGGFVLDQRDADQAHEIEAMGLRVRVLDTLMRDTAAAARLAEAALSLAGEL
jgi:LPPG:FO 2-phospho-L-lactate transferase